MSIETPEETSPSREIILRGTGFFGYIKKLDDKRYHQYLSSMINFSEEVRINNVSDLTSIISFFEYGPMLTIYELEDFCKKIMDKQKMLKPFHKQLFFFLWTIISNTPKKAIDTSILVFKFPYCFMLKFGAEEDIKHCIHFDNNMYYNLQEKHGTMYQPAYYETALEGWKELVHERKQEYNEVIKYKHATSLADIEDNTANVMEEAEKATDKIESNIARQKAAAQRMRGRQEKIRNLIAERDEEFQKMREMPSSVGAQKEEKKPLNTY